MLLSIHPSVHPSIAYIANNSRTQRPSMPKFGRKVPTFDATRIPVTRSKVISQGHVISLSRLGPMLYLCHLRPAGHTMPAKPGGHTSCYPPFASIAKGEVFGLLYVCLFVCLFVNDFSTIRGPIHAIFCMRA